MPDATPISLPFDEAVAFLRQKVNLPTRAWTDLWEDMHARAFVVAGAMREELLADLHGALVTALRQGTTLAQFRKAFEEIVAARGWTGWTGEGTARGRAWRARVIWDTNLRMAYAAGRWNQVQRTKDARPYLRYSAVMDSRTRPDHQAWHGTILPVDHPWWQTHYPPNGWYCRCTVVQLSARDLERQGWAVSERAPAVPLVTRDIKGRGTVSTPKGIDPGFGGNVGRASWGQDAQSVAMEQAGPMEAMEVAGGRLPADPGDLEPVAARAGLGRRAGDEDGLRAALRAAIGGDERVLADPLGGRVLITQALVDHMLVDQKRHDGREAYWPLIPELIAEPQEIWIGFAQSTVSGRVKLRRRYVRLVDLGGGRSVGLIADAAGGLWVSATFFRGGLRPGFHLRSGIRIFGG